jgi:hypothetical protein
MEMPVVEVLPGVDTLNSPSGAKVVLQFEGVVTSNVITQPSEDEFVHPVGSP